MSLSYLKYLESESIHIIRETVAEFKNPVMLYSVGKDSSVMIRLALKAFYPGKIPFPVMHVDTGFKFPEMYSFRDAFVKQTGLDLIVYRNEAMIAEGTNPWDLGTDKCCFLLKTKALLDGLRYYGFDAAFGGARREEEKSRAKERVFSVRDRFGQWDPKAQRPELWNLYNGLIKEGESVRVFPLSNWTELDIWNYILLEKIPVVPIYFSIKRKAYFFSGKLHTVFPVDYVSDFLQKRMDARIKEGTLSLESAENVSCRFRSLGCIPCTGAVRSEADDVAGIVAELRQVKKSERENRLIDLSSESSMEQKKREGYF
jgi:sulfate adenylyltransferase subunit 2